MSENNKHGIFILVAAIVIIAVIVGAVGVYAALTFLRTVNTTGVATTSEFFTLNTATIDWGTVNAGSAVTRTIRITSVINQPQTLTFTTTIPSTIGVVTWNASSTLSAMETATLAFTLTLVPTAPLDTFNGDIVMTGAV